jgi:hypothetical protein
MLFLLTLLGGPGSATVISFTGVDLGVSPSSPTGPNSSAAAASFDAAAAALGNVSIITFEGSPIGSFANLTVLPGVSINGTDVNGNSQTIHNAPNPAFPPLDGYNTTLGGSEFGEMMGGNLVFTFATPIQFFGAYFSGVQTIFFTDTLTFSDGTSQTVDIPGTGTSNNVGALVFAGFTDAGKSISIVTINAGVPGDPGAGFDDMGVDDVRFQASTQATPEPGSMALALAGCCFGLVLLLRRGLRV